MYDSLLEQKLDRRLDLVDSLQMAMGDCLEAILYAYRALHNLGTFDFVALNLFSAGGRQWSVVAELLRLIEMIEDPHTEVQGIISYPHL